MPPKQRRRQTPACGFSAPWAGSCKGEKLPDAEKILLNYIHAVPRHPSYPGPWAAHYWLGQLYEKQKNLAAARGEYGAALKLNAKYKKAQDALKQLGKS